MFNKTLLPGVLPSSLERLQFGDSYDQQFEMAALPHALKILAFGYSYNQQFKLGVLPLSLEQLYLGSSYNQRIESGVLPSSLLGLRFWLSESIFDHPLEAGVLPSNLRILELGTSFRSELSLPMSVNRLVINKQHYFFTDALFNKGWRRFIRVWSQGNGHWYDDDDRIVRLRKI